MAKDNPISRFVERYTNIVPNPLAHAALLGTAAYGASKLGYNSIMRTIRSLGRVPGRQLANLSNDEWDEAMDEMLYNSNYSTWLPVGLGALAAVAAASPHFSPYRKNFGLTAWDSPIQSHHAASNSPGHNRDINESLAMPMVKLSSYGMHKVANSLFTATGYDANAMDMSKVVDVGRARSLFNSDPFLANDSYTRNFGNSIINNAAINTGVSNPTLGNVFDSAKNKISNKLTIQGIADIGMKSVVANQTARLFTGVLDTMIGLSPTTQRNIIDTGTWAGTVSAILN